MSDYIEGQLVRLSAAFTDAAGAAADPTTVTLKYLPASAPGATTTTLTYPEDTEIVKDSTGNYHYDLPLDDPGAWVWRWESTGDAQAATQGEFSVARAAL
jgi:hypothetical protein